jgi:hypothetical protein
VIILGGNLRTTSPEARATGTLAAPIDACPAVARFTAFGCSALGSFAPLLFFIAHRYR